MIELRILLIIVGIVLAGSIQHITVPIMVGYFSSLYFIIILTTLEGCLNFGLLLLYCTRGKFARPKAPKIIILAAFFNTMMSLCFIYTANPQRTPVIIQSIFLGLTIIPSVFFRKFILKKIVLYNMKYIIPSVILLLISVGISTIPLYSQWELKNIVWIFGYLLAVFLLSVESVMQEKYIAETNDTTFQNKITLAFYMSLSQIIFLIAFCWVELVFGYTGDPLTAFKNSASLFVHDLKLFFMLELYIYDCLILYLLSIYLNSISTNYHMILTNVTNQSVAIFFTVFPGLNHGIKYALYITLPSLAFNISSVFLWIKGEHNEEKLPLTDEPSKSYGTSIV